VRAAILCAGCLRGRHRASPTKASSLWRRHALTGTQVDVSDVKRKAHGTQWNPWPFLSNNPDGT
jgi:hypothetical protein